MPSTSRERTSSQGQWRPGSLAIALITGRLDAARIAAAVRPLPVSFVDTVDELWQALAQAGGRCAGIVVESRDSRGTSTAPFITHVVRGAYRIPVLGYTGAGAARWDCARDLAMAGVHELAFRDVDTTPALLAAKFSRSEEACAAAAVLTRIAPYTPRRLHGMADFVLNYPRDDHSVTAVARSLGVSRRTLVNWCASAKVLPPARIISWCRILLAAELLQVPGRAVEPLANCLEFASGSAFRNLCQRYLGQRPTTLSNPGALDEAYLAYRRHMSPAGADIRIDRSVATALHAAKGH